METKGEEGDIDEERGERLDTGERGEWRERGRGGALRVSFHDGFYGVTSNADLPHPDIPHAPSLHPSVHSSLPPLSHYCVRPSRQ